MPIAKVPEGGEDDAWHGGGTRIDQARDDRVIRVAHVGEYARESAVGPHHAVGGLLKHLPRHGVEAELWQFKRSVQVPSWAEVDGIRVLYLPARGVLAAYALGLPAPTKEAIAERSREVDLVHFHSVFIAENSRAAPRLDAPYLISPRGGYNRSVLEGRNRAAKKIWLALYESRYMKNASALHAVSRGEVAELEALLPSEKIFYIPNGISQDVLDRPLKEPSGKDFVFLGRLAIQHKGLDLLLDGYAAFLEKTGDRSSSLTIAGPDFRGDREWLDERIRALGLQDRVRLPGGVFAEEKWRLIEEAYAFVLTSRWEGMPFALLEALAVGRPALVTPGTNMAELVDEYDAGIRVQADPRDIASGFERFLTMPAEDHVAMRERARRLIQERLTWDRITGKLVGRYREIVGDQRSYSNLGG